MSDALTEPRFGEATLTDCDREPIHIPGSIQPHGCLIALAPGTLEIVHWAGDLRRIIGWSEVDPIGKSLAELIGIDAARKIEAARRFCAPNCGLVKNYELAIPTPGGPVDAILHPAGDSLIIEFEPTREDGGTHSTLFTVQNMLAEVNATTSLADYHYFCAAQIQTLTGFGRVMIYRFLEDGSGTVIAEAKADRFESFLGLHYPESDIPKQAREMYRSNWLRCIPNIAYTPLPLHPQTDPRSGKPLDMTYSTFRSVSPLHLQYLENMGVRASMSLSIVNGDRLWGLIACHHDAPHYLGCQTRAACELFAQVFSLQLEARERAETYEYSLQQRSVHQELVNRLAREEILSDGLIRYRPNLLDLVQADGVAVFVDGEYAEAGHTPGQAVVSSLLRRLDAREDGVFATDSISASFPDLATGHGETAGLLALSVSRSPKDSVLWFRREVIETVNWAGNPAKAIQIVDGTEKLTPRSSFAEWRETVRGRSRPWKANEIEAVEALRLSILEVVLRRMDEVARERAEAHERQALLVAELDHRVKNTIANIQSLMRHSRRSQTTLDGYVESLEKRIKAMAYTHNLLSQSRWRGVDLQILLEDEMRPHRDSGHEISLAGQAVKLKPTAALTLSMVFHELTTNAAKYGALSNGAGQLQVSWAIENGALRIEWREADGPQVEPPSRRGFGRTIIEQSLPYELDGEVSLRFKPEGLECDISVPTAHVHYEEPHEAGETERSAASKTAVSGPTKILLVEDSMVTALDLARTIEDEGFEVLGPTGRVSVALGIIERETVESAILDINLGNEDSFPIADALIGKNIPFAFLTGYDAASVLPQRFLGIKCLTKPFGDEALIKVINSLTNKQ
jgi:two-component system, chemotaxis family, sensor kinase Cph1